MNFFRNIKQVYRKESIQLSVFFSVALIAVLCTAFSLSTSSPALVQDKSNMPTQDFSDLKLQVANKQDIKNERLVITGSSTLPTATSIHTETEAHWEERIKALGGVAAYKEFSDLMNATVPDVQAQHEQAHLFGKALYKQEGIAGISVCDTNFLYGCFHQVTAQTFAAQGLGILPKLNDVCEKNTSQTGFSFCQHGIGHGIIGFLGYSEKALQESLTLCGTLSTPPSMETLDGCSGGVFMEFNGHSLVGDGDTPRQPNSKDDFLYPCSIVDSAFTSACYLKQARWWVTTYFDYTNTASIYPQMGKWCNTVTNADSRQACFAGVGVAASGPVQDSSDLKTAQTLCGAATSDAKNKLTCESFAVLGVGLSGYTDKALSICKQLPALQVSYCSDYALVKKYLTIQSVPKNSI